MEKENPWNFDKNLLQARFLYLSLALFCIAILGLSAVIVLTCTPSQVLRAAGYPIKLLPPKGETIVNIAYFLRLALLRRTTNPPSSSFWAKILVVVCATIWIAMVFLLLGLEISWRSWVLGWPFKGSNAFDVFYHMWMWAICLSVLAPRGRPSSPFYRAGTTAKTG